MKADLSILPKDRPISAVRPRREPQGFYVNIAVFMAAIVIVGFWTPYFGPLLRGNAARPWEIHLHGMVFVGWMALLFAQVLLVYLGRIRQHRMIGNFGIAYGFLVVIMGVIAAFAGPIHHIKSGEWEIDRAAGFLLISLRAITVFGIFFVASIAYKGKPEIHKRLILLATVALLFAPVGRMISIQAAPLFLVVWLSPLLAAVGRDAVAARRVHPTFIIGLVLLLLGFTPVLIRETDSYMNFGRSLLKIFI